MKRVTKKTGKWDLGVMGGITMESFTTLRKGERKEGSENGGLKKRCHKKAGPHAPRSSSSSEHFLKRGTLEKSGKKGKGQSYYIKTTTNTILKLKLRLFWSTGGGKVLEGGRKGG